VLDEAKARDDSLGENPEPRSDLEDAAGASELAGTVTTAEHEVNPTVVTVTTGLVDDGRVELAGRMEEAPAPATGPQGCGRGLLVHPLEEVGESANGAAAQGREEGAREEGAEEGEPVESAQTESDTVSLLRRCD
jgi:hypothetical protein